MSKTIKGIPKGALRFIEPNNHAEVYGFEHTDGTGTTPKLRMVAYNGGLIKGHWYWGDLAIDLKGIKFTKNKFPILENHDTNKKIAFTGKPKIDDGKLEIDSDKTVFVDTEESQEFQKLSQKGFPYESSIYAVPSNIERLEKDATAEVNGFTMRGPGSIWRVCEFKEASVCVFGWDSKTQASAFSKEKEEIEVDEIVKGNSSLDQLVVRKNKKGEEVESMLTIEGLKKDNPEVYEAIVEEVTTALEKKFSEETSEMKRIETDLRDQMNKKDERLLSLEKRETIRTENELRDTASIIWKERLSQSDVPERLYDKVSKHVSYTSFMENGRLDVTKFTEAIDKEIEDWVGRGIKTSIIGSGFTTKEADSSEAKEKVQLADENKKATNTLLRIAGQKVENE